MKMKVPKALKSVRYCLAAVNSLFLVTGFILLAVGLIVLNKYNIYDVLITNKFFTIPNFAIATAAIIFFTSILGFYGAISEQFYFIAGYVVLLVVVLIFEISITVLGFQMQNNASSEIRNTMLSTLRLYGRADMNVAWDNLQMGFECCGVVGVHDWPAHSLPVSCCRIEPGTISPFECSSLTAYGAGCQARLGDWLAYNAYAIGVTAAFVTCLQVLITAAAAYLAYRSKFEEVELER